MGTRAETLADQYTQMNDDLIATVEGCSGEQWAAKCPDTGWSAGVQAHHIAAGQPFIAQFVGKIANGEQITPVTMEMIDQGNAKHAEQFANVSKDEVLTALRANGEQVGGWLRSLSDEQLDRQGTLLAGTPESSVEGMIRFLAFGEIERHGATLRQAVGA